MASKVPRTTFSPEPHLLTPEDAYYSSPPRHHHSSSQQRSSSTTALSSLANHTTTGSTASLGSGGSNNNNNNNNNGVRSRYARSGIAGSGGDERRSRSRRRRNNNIGGGGGGGNGGDGDGPPLLSRYASGKWKKLLWIKQPYPDNYTDPSTFLLHLQRNPRLQAYDFWPLVADSMVIVQHVCAVALFVCCFVAIYQERVSPVAVVGTGTACSLVGWLMWDAWLGRDERDRDEAAAAAAAAAAARARELQQQQQQESGQIGSNTTINNNNSGGSVRLTEKKVGGGTKPGDGDVSLSGGGVSGISSPPSGTTTPGLGITSSTPASSSFGGHGGGRMSSSNNTASKPHSRSQSSTSLASYSYGASTRVSPSTTAATNLSPSISSPSSPSPSGFLPPHPHHHHHHFPYQPSNSLLSSRNQQRLATAKSALLIYLALLGLSPILKSLTLSTTSDSIWAMSCWLLLTNIFTFDYGSSTSPAAPAAAAPAASSQSPSSTNKNTQLSSASSSQQQQAPSSSSSSSPSTRFPASLSTNAALMASTVLASRLPSTTHVFSLTLFSIEVFGLFPVFRRHLRHRSFALHLLLTVLLILGSGAGLGVILIGGGGGGGDNGGNIIGGGSSGSVDGGGGDKSSSSSISIVGFGIGDGGSFLGDVLPSTKVASAAAVGALVWSLGSLVAMGGCSWWLIGLQRYKNVVIGPWDPARPIIRAGAWD